MTVICIIVNEENINKIIYKIINNFSFLEYNKYLIFRD